MLIGPGSEILGFLRIGCRSEYSRDLNLRTVKLEPINPSHKCRVVSFRDARCTPSERSLICRTGLGAVFDSTRTDTPLVAVCGRCERKQSLSSCCLRPLSWGPLSSVRKLMLIDSSYRFRLRSGHEKPTLGEKLP